MNRTHGKGRAAVAMLFAAASLAGCDTVPVEEDVFSVSGSVAYRERVALPADSTVRVILADVAAAGKPAEIGEFAVKTGGEQVPISFRITVDRAELDARGRYAVAAAIADPAGTPVWQTAQAHPVDTGPAQVDVGMLTLVRAAAASLDGDWTVTGVGGAGTVGEAPATLRFGPDGRLSGSSGCNAFGGRYEAGTGADGPTLTVGPLAVSQRACEAAVDAQERRLVGALGAAAGYRIEADGTLTITAKDGTTIRARR
jgi:putative lipoprotein